MKLIKILDVKNKLGEGIVWHPNQQSLWWTDIHSAKLYCYFPHNDSHKVYDMPERVGCFGFIDGENALIVAFASGIAKYHIENQTLEWLARPELENKGNRFNDGRVDRNGCFWAGTMVENSTSSSAKGKLYQLTDNGDIHVHINDIGISNSLCWSPCGNTLYHADSPSNTIYQYSVKLDNAQRIYLTNKKVFARTESDIFPDGATVDKYGNLWSAQWAGSRLVKYAPTGEQLAVFDMPVSQPTCIAIGGPKGDLLCVSSAIDKLSLEALDKEPNAGNVFIYQLTENIAVPEKYVDIKNWNRALPE